MIHKINCSDFVSIYTSGLLKVLQKTKTIDFVIEIIIKI